VFLKALKRSLPDRHPWDKYLLPYLSFWTSIILRRKKPLIIGVTGTAGKTTVTKMIGHVLMQGTARPYVGIAGTTPGNNNGDYGVRLSILRKKKYPHNWARRLVLFAPLPLDALWKAFSRSYPRVLVLEYGTYEAGHIHDLVKFAPASIAVVTNIGPAHLQRHKTIEGVYIEKRALVMGVPPGGLVVLGEGHDFVSRLEADSKAPVVKVDGRGLTLAQNITRVVCRHLGVPHDIIEEGLKTFKPPEGRLNKFESRGILVIDDAFNANPLSMKLGLDMLAQEVPNGGRRVALLGVMRELGDQSSIYHNEIGKYAMERSDLVVGVGEGAQDYQPHKWFANSAECARELNTLVQPGDVVLIKGSHFSNMAVVVRAMRTENKA
jgi:UDP-N-acetylmuramoyl-tripeptide--D-alanyl-D-alanine ligase